MSFSTLNTPTALSLADAEEIRGTARWARIIAIIGFVMLGIMLLFGVFFSTFMARVMSMSAAMTGAAVPVDFSMLGMFYTVLFIVIVLIYFFPVLFLYRYATRTLKALRGPFDAAAFSAGLGAHRSFYGYIGVLTIISLVLNGIGLIFLLIAGLAMGRMADHAGGITM